MKMSETYFITGAQGCIGSWIVKTLVERGDQAVVFDRSNDSRRLAAIMNAEDLAQVRFITGDITDGIAVRMDLSYSEAQHLIHLAGLRDESGVAPRNNSKPFELRFRL